MITLAVVSMYLGFFAWYRGLATASRGTQFRAAPRRFAIVL